MMEPSIENEDSFWTLTNKKTIIHGKINSSNDISDNFSDFTLEKLTESFKGTMVLSLRPHIDNERSRDKDRFQYKCLAKNSNLCRNFINLSERIEFESGDNLADLRGVYCNIKDHILKEMERKNFYDTLIIDMNIFNFNSEDVRGHFPSDTSDNRDRSKKHDYRGNFPNIDQVRKVAIVIQNIFFAVKDHLVGKKELHIYYSEALLCSKFDINPFTVKSVIQLEHYVQLCDTILLQLVNELKNIDPDVVKNNMQFTTSEAMASGLCHFSNDLTKYIEPLYAERPGIWYIHGCLAYRRGFQYNQSLMGLLFIYSLMKYNNTTKYLHNISMDPESNLENFPTQKKDVAYMGCYKRFFGVKGFLRPLSPSCLTYQDNIGERFPIPPAVITAYNKERLKTCHPSEIQLNPVWTTPIDNSLQSAAKVLVSYPLNIFATENQPEPIASYSIYKPNNSQGHNSGTRSKNRKRSRNTSTDNDQIEIIELDDDSSIKPGTSTSEQKNSNSAILEVCNKILVQTSEFEKVKQDIQNITSQLNNARIENDEEITQENNLLREQINKMNEKHVSTMENWNREKSSLYNEIERLKTENKNLSEQNITRLNVSSENVKLGTQVNNLTKIIDKIKDMYNVHDTSEIINTLCQAKSRAEDCMKLNISLQTIGSKLEEKAKTTLQQESEYKVKLDAANAKIRNLTETINQAVDENHDLKTNLDEAKENMVTMLKHLPICYPQYPQLNESQLSDPTMTSMKLTILSKDFVAAMDRCNASLQFTRQIIDNLNNKSGPDFNDKSEQERAQIVASILLDIIKESLIVEELTNKEYFSEATIAFLNQVLWPTPSQSQNLQNSKKKKA